MAKEITNEFKLRQGEAVISRVDKIGYGTPISTRNNELVLTNQALIHIKKDLFGKVKEVVRYPFSDICMSAGRPQVVIGAGDNVSGSVNIYLEYETLNFKFQLERQHQLHQ